MKSPLFLSLLVLAAALFVTPVRAEDGFDPIAAQLTDRAVVMKLPEGVRRVRLRVKNEDGSWKVCTIAHLEGNEGHLKLRLPDGVAKENIEVSASWTDPFPYSFYQGASKHEGTASNGQSPAPTSGPQALEDGVGQDRGAEVTVEESDIWKWRGSTLYFFNQYRGLQVIDVADPAAPKRVASMRVNSYGEQMYLHPEEDLVILLTYDSSSGNGEVLLVAHEAPDVLQQRASFPVPGYILESRLIGNILYVVSRNYWQDSITNADGTTHISWSSGLAVTKIDLSDPAHPVADPPLNLQSTQYNYWGAQVQATPEALLVATNAYDSARQQSISTVHVIDISDPSVAPTVTHHLPVAGQVLNKFNMNLQGDILTVASQVWRGNVDRRRYASVETFDLTLDRARLAGIEFANNEGITATRFVGDLLYVVTFLRVDPLFVISLADPSRPRILSELEIPGFSTYLQPLGSDALLSIGVEGSQIAVSWFDVGDPTNTSLASRVFIGAEDGWSWTEANWDEKALGYFPNDGLLLVPYQGSVPGEGWVSGVQLVELGEKQLTKRGSFAHEFSARRARVLGDAVVSISGLSLRSLDITDRDHPRLLSELTLAWPADLVHRVGEYLIQLERGPGYWWYSPTTDTARLHISPQDDPDELLASLALPGGRIAGSYRHGDCLFVAQSQTLSEEEAEGVVYSESFTTTVIGLTDPRQPTVLGRTSHNSSGENYRWGGGAEYTGALLPDGALVWYPAEQSYYFLWDVAPVDGIGGAPLRDSAFPYYASSGQVYTLDISDKTNPLPLATATLSGGENEWPAGEIVLLGSTIYYGLQSTAQKLQPDGTTRWFSKQWLGHLDLSDPAAPVTGDHVSVPGSLEHVLSTPAGGIVVFTSSYASRLEEGTYHSQFLIQALAFDGLEAFLLNELVAREDNHGPHVFHDRYLVLGTNYYGSSVEDYSTELVIFEWRNSGAFAEVRSAELAGSIYRLGVADNLLLTTSSDGLSFIDFVDPADLEPASVSFSGVNFWYRPELIEIHERAQAYLPQGFYGVESLDFGGVFAESVPDASPSPGQNPRPEWEVVPFALLNLTSSSSSQLLGSLDQGANWIFDDLVEPIPYQEWTRRALGLSPTDPVPSFFEDTDLDGRSNGWEYFTGTDPGKPGGFSPFRVSITTTPEGERYLTGSLFLNPHAGPYVVITPRASFNLETWDDSPARFETTVEHFLTGTNITFKEPLRNRGEAFMQVELSTLTE